MKFNVLAMEAVFQLHICNVAISFYPCSIPNPTQLKDHGCSFFYEIQRFSQGSCHSMYCACNYTNAMVLSDEITQASLRPQTVASGTRLDDDQHIYAMKYCLS